MPVWREESFGDVCALENSFAPLGLSRMCLPFRGLTPPATNFRSWRGLPRVAAQFEGNRRGDAHTGATAGQARQLTVKALAAILCLQRSTARIERGLAGSAPLIRCLATDAPPCRGRFTG